MVPHFKSPTRVAKESGPASQGIRVWAPILVAKPSANALSLREAAGPARRGSTLPRGGEGSGAPSPSNIGWLTQKASTLSDP